MANVPTDLKYTKSHEWVRIEGDTATIGITDHAQSELGDIVYIDLPSVGRSLSVEEGFGSVESVKTVSDLYAPISGEVIETNANLAGQSELVNTDPYLGGWMIKVKMGNSADADALMSPAEYEATI